MALDADRYRLTEDEHQAIFERRIKPELFSGAKPADRPVAVIFGGQPGAGKSAAVDDAAQALAGRGGAVQVIGDDLRSFHPRHAPLMERDDKTAAFYTDRDSGRWVEKSIAYAKEHRLNLIIEGTMRSPAVVADTMQGLRHAGYEIDARALAVNERLSWQGVMQRYEANAKLRALVVPQGSAQPQEASEAVVATACEAEPIQFRSGRISWARLLKRVFDIDMHTCPNCGGGELKIIAAILERPVIEKILTHLGLDPQPPPRGRAREVVQD